jgi:hypothetical protein
MGAGITRRYRTVFLPDHRLAVHLPAPFRAVRTCLYGPDGHRHGDPASR